MPSSRIYFPTRKCANWRNLVSNTIFEVDLKWLHQNIVYKCNWNNAKLVKKELAVIPRIEEKKMLIIVNMEGIPTIPSRN